LLLLFWPGDRHARGCRCRSALGCRDRGRDAVLAHLHAQTAAADLELLHVLRGEALQELGHQCVRIGTELLWVSHRQAQRRSSSAALWPPNPIELESETSTCCLRATFGT